MMFDDAQFAHTRMGELKAGVTRNFEIGRLIGRVAWISDIVTISCWAEEKTWPIPAEGVVWSPVVPRPPAETGMGTRDGLIQRVADRAQIGRTSLNRKLALIGFEAYWCCTDRRRLLSAQCIENAPAIRDAPTRWWKPLVAAG